ILPSFIAKTAERLVTYLTSNFKELGIKWIPSDKQAAIKQALAAAGLKSRIRIQHREGSNMDDYFISKEKEASKSTKDEEEEGPGSSDDDEDDDEVTVVTESKQKKKRTHGEGGFFKKIWHKLQGKQQKQ